jgi:hypothetical protein
MVVDDVPPQRRQLGSLNRDAPCPLAIAAMRHDGFLCDRQIRHLRFTERDIQRHLV